jgi:hypothetical protein
MATLQRIRPCLWFDEFELDGQKFTALNGGPCLHVQRSDLAYQG